MPSAIFTAFIATLAQGGVDAPASSSFNFYIWKVVVIVGVGAVILFYLLKRFADAWNHHKTGMLIAQNEIGDVSSPPEDEVDYPDDEDDIPVDDVVIGADAEDEDDNPDEEEDNPEDDEAKGADAEDDEDNA